MIIVTGTKRSGTSMWMQVLQAAGLPVIGEAFPSVWEESIQQANPRGFFESRFRNGVFYVTNPDPKTGSFIHPAQSRRHTVKVFIPGLIRTDFAYLGRVIATVRNWRSYGGSIKRLYDMEDVWLKDAGPEKLERALKARPKIPAAVEWWFDNYELIRDVSTRRYAFHVTTYERVLAEPRAQIGKVLDWLGGELDLDAAVAAIEPTLRSQSPDPAAEEELDPETVAVFDEYYQAVHENGRLGKALLERMNVTWKNLEDRYGRPSQERKVRE